MSWIDEEAKIVEDCKRSKEKEEGWINIPVHIIKKEEEEKKVEMDPGWDTNFPFEPRAGSCLHHRFLAIKKELMKNRK